MMELSSLTASVTLLLISWNLRAQLLMDLHERVWLLLLLEDGRGGLVLVLDLGA